MIYMTNEEAIKILEGAIKKPNTKDGYLGQAIDMAIKALKQQSILDTRQRERQLEIEYQHGYDKGWEEGRKALKQQPCDKCVYSTKDGYCQYDDIAKIIPTKQPPYKGMRDATEEECKSTKDYIDSISKPTGLQFDDIYEELDFVQPHKKISANLRIGKSINKVRNDMKIIVLHDRYSNEPMVIRVDAINAIKKCKDGQEEYSDIFIDSMCVDVKETIGIVMNKIQKTESGVNIDE